MIFSGSAETPKEVTSMTKVMIVDDNLDITKVLDILMKKEGFETAIAHDGKEFLDKVGKEKPDLVLLDVMMPGLTTKQILETLNKSEDKDVDIILVTVVRMSDSEKKSIMSNYNIKDYITKPFDVEDMINRIRKVLG